MTWILWVLLAILWGGDALRMRGRARALARLEPSDADPTGFSVVASPGCSVDDATLRAAAAHARREGLEALDLVPADLPAWRALFLLATCDVPRYRTSIIAHGRGAGHAVVLADSLRERLGDVSVEDAAAFQALTARCKQYASRATDLAVAPDLRTSVDGSTARRLLLAGVFGDLTQVVFLVQTLMVLVAAAGLFVAPVAAAVALGLLQLQPLFATAGTALRPRDLALVTLLRAPLDLVEVVRLIAAGPPRRPDPVAPLRPVYRDLVAEGVERFFEPRRDDCPLCGGRDLAVRLRTDDLFQHKPGRFHLDRCNGCGHMFQNPRLSIEGLDYYYKDAYDGLNAERVESLFAFSDGPYLARARTVTSVGTPSRWLDVGGGHGHFAAVAGSVLEGTRFDGLDLSASIEEAERRRWIARGWRGLFPDLADTLAGEGYDTISMSHYLEHTRDPAAEIAAAARVLGPGGHLFIELPDPESRLGRILGSYWVPWFQPQHQHLLSVGNLEKLLRAHGFEPVVWDRGEAHLANDFHLAAVLLMGRLGRGTDVPWRSAPSLAAKAWGKAIFWMGLPVVLGAWALDVALAPMLRRPGWSNAYRVVARRASKLTDQLGHMIND